MRNQLLSHVVADLIPQFVKLRQSACITLLAAAIGKEAGCVSAVKYLQWLHKHSAPTIVLDVWAGGLLLPENSKMPSKRAIENAWEENTKGVDLAPPRLSLKSPSLEGRKDLKVWEKYSVRVTGLRGVLETLPAEIKFPASVWSARAFFSITEILPVPNCSSQLARRFRMTFWETAGSSNSDPFTLTYGAILFFFSLKPNSLNLEARNMVPVP